MCNLFKNLVGATIGEKEHSTFVESEALLKLSIITPNGCLTGTDVRYPPKYQNFQG